MITGRGRNYRDYKGQGRGRLKIAIIGAGVSGLACALALEKYGLTPEVFEQHGRPGGITPQVQTILQIVHRPAPDPLKDLAANYGLSLIPIGTVKKIVMRGPGETATVTGHLGYTFERGHSPRSLDCQLYGTLSRTRVKFHTTASLPELAAQYDRVVVATGSPFMAREAGCYSEILRSWARGAVLEGSFDPATLVVWFNRAYTGDGFVYLAPFGSRKASVILEATDIGEQEVEARWRWFWEKEKPGGRETQVFRREHNVGICCPREYRNIIFIGLAAGLLDYTLGFGLYNAVISGTLAAQAIYEGSSYEEKIGALLQRSYYSYLIRLGQNSLSNEDYDRILRLLNLPYVAGAVYHTGLDVVRLLAASLRLAGKGALAAKFEPAP